VQQVPAAQANILLAKFDIPDPALNGTLLNYTIVLNNTGSANATNLTVGETYDQNVTFVNAIPFPDVDSNNATFTLGTVFTDQIRTINISVLVNASATAGTPLNNTVNASFFDGITNTTVFASILTTVREVDVEPPVVLNVTPLAGSQFNVSDLINISVNVTDNVEVDTVLANITFPNSSDWLHLHSLYY